VLARYRDGETPYSAVKGRRKGFAGAQVTPARDGGDGQVGRGEQVGGGLGAGATHVAGRRAAGVLDELNHPGI
jgi:hypothetical protein